MAAFVERLLTGWASCVPWKQNLENLEDFEKETFEHGKLPDSSTQKDALLPLRPIWFPAPKDSTAMRAK